MDKVNFFGHELTRLIVGDNPMNGHSYIEEIIPGADMKEFYTSEKIKEDFKHIEETGYNAMLPLAGKKMSELHTQYHNEGGNLKLIWQCNPDYMDSVRLSMLTPGTIGLYQSGSLTDLCWENGKIEKIKENIKKMKEFGLPVGLGTHRPETIERAEEEDWGADFYLACLQNARRGREGEQSGFITGKTKAGLIFYPEDRPIMLNTIKNTKKPVLTFKIFAGGQMFVDKTEEERKEIIKGVYEEIFASLKPNDIAILGTFQRDRDEIKIDYDLYMEWYNSKK